MNEERYQMTEHGIAIHERYTVTLVSAEEAIRLANWLIWHYVEIEQLRRRQVDAHKKEVNA